MTADVTVVIPSIPGRRQSFEAAVASVRGQTVPAELLVMQDNDRVGAAITRNRALSRVVTPWIAWLDDDDVLYPQHVEGLRACADATDADLIYPWFDLEHLGTIRNDYDPLRAPWNGIMVSPFAREYGDEQRTFLLQSGNFVPVTHLVRTELVQRVGGFPQTETEEWPAADCEDWGYLQRLLRAGAVFHHYGERTWMWRHHGLNTSGRGDRWY